MGGLEVFGATGEASGLQALGVNGQAFLVQLVTFLLFFFILEKFAIKPILKRLNARRQVIDDGVKLGLELEKQKAHLDEQIAAALQNARTEADRIIEEGKKSARKTVEDAEAAAKEKAEHIMDDAFERAKNDARRARAALEEEVAALVGEVAEAVVGRSFDGAADSSAIKKAVKEQLQA